jgi:hypothetical protein
MRAPALSLQIVRHGDEDQFKPKGLTNRCKTNFESQPSIRLIKWNNACDRAGRIQDANFTLAEAGARFRIVDGLALL